MPWAVIATTTHLLDSSASPPIWEVCLFPAQFLFGCFTGMLLGMKELNLLPLVPFFVVGFYQVAYVVACVCCSAGRVAYLLF
jgi:hypothetical protein